MLYRHSSNKYIRFYMVLAFTIILSVHIFKPILTEKNYLQSDITINQPEFDEIRYDENGIKKTLWPDDPECSNLTAQFAVKTDLVYFVSYPRSGNTWVRYMLEAVTGIFSGSVYHGKPAFELGFLGEFEPVDSGRVSPIKSHGRMTEKLPSMRTRYLSISPDVPVILLMRDPEKALLSHYSFRLSRHLYPKDLVKAHFNDLDDTKYKTKEFHEFTTPSILWWEQVNVDRLLWSKNLLVVFYENLIEEPLEQLKRIVSFMGFPINSQRFDCLQKHIEGPTKRKHGDVGVSVW